jgi:hypothetical protein
MNIGIDLDGTITENPAFFSLITMALVAQNHEVHIVTYRDLADEVATIQELAALNIQYTRLHLPPANAAIAAWKLKIATEVKLDMMIDDMPEVLESMPASTQRLWFCDPAIYDLKRCIKALHKTP